MTQSITNLSAVVTPASFSASKRNALVTGALFALTAWLEKNKPAVAYTAPSTDAGKVGEARFNNPEDAMCGSATYKALVETMTGDTLSDLRHPAQFTPALGLVVTPVKPVYRDRTDDGYEAGEFYLITNETTGRARNASNLGTGYLNSKHGYGVKPMSRLADEWQVVTDQATIEQVIDAIIALPEGLKVVNGMLSDTGPSLLPYLEAIAK